MSRPNKFQTQNKPLRAPLDASSGGFSRENRTGEEAPRAGPQASGAAALDTTAKSVGRSARFRHQRHAAKLLQGKGRVGLCRWSVISKSAGVDVVETSYEGDGRGTHFEGVQTCGSVWLCPCCGARISETRRQELNQLLTWARAQGYVVQMITLTARHGREDDLAELLDAMKEAKRSWGQHRAYRRILNRRNANFIGSVTATECTGGGFHGWHPHFHMLVITAGHVDLNELREPWLSSLRAEGLDGTGSGWLVQDASAAGNYVAKWGAAEELSLKDAKKGRGGRSPAQLLADSADGDVRAGYLWREYAEAFHGRRQLVWSRGLKALAGIGEVDDKEAAQDQQQEGQQEVSRVNIPHGLWQGQVASRRVDRRGELLDRAEAVGPHKAIEELRSDASVIDRDDMSWRPRPGGLAERLIGSIVEPPPRKREASRRDRQTGSP